MPVEASLANPIDILGSANAETYEHVIPPILADPNVDALIALFVPPVVEDPRTSRNCSRGTRRNPTSRCSPS